MEHYIQNRFCLLALYVKHFDIPYYSQTNNYESFAIRCVWGGGLFAPVTICTLRYIVLLVL